MKKLSILFLTALVSRNIRCSKAVNLFILAFALSSMSYSAFAQVVVTPATGGTSVCTAPSTCTTLGNITITETTNADYAIAASQIILAPPAGWQFCTGTTPVVTHLPGDITGAITVTITSTSLKLDINATGTSLHDAVTIAGLQVQALSPTAAPGFIYASSVSGVTGITVGPGAGATDFGDLALIPTPIVAPLSICIGSCVTVTSTPSGGVWTSANPSLATVNSTSGLVCGVGAGIATISYTVSGCTATTVITIASNPPPISGLLPAGGPYHLCAWYDTLSISDAITTGIYNSSLVTVDNLGGGNGKLRAHAPGTATVTYTLPSGCSTTSTIIVDPLPAPIQSPPYVVCQGSTKTLTDASTPGTWSTVNPAIGSIDPVTGVFLGVSPGDVLVIYTIPGGYGSGCVTDTTMHVNPLPSFIVAIPTNELCLGTAIKLADATAGGVWSAVPSSGVITVTPATVAPDTAVVVGTGVGTAIVSYTLPTGCAATIPVTVDPLPGSITGPHQVCVNDSVLLSPSTPGGVWTSSDPAIGAIDPASGYIRGIAAGVVTVTYTILPGSCISTYLVTVNPLPAPIVGPDQVCVGTTASFTDASPGGSWSVLSSPPISTIDVVGTLTPNFAGVETVVYTLPTGCRITHLLTINPLPSPIIGADSLCLHDSTTLTIVSSPGGSWTSSSFVLYISTTYPDSVVVVAQDTGVGSIVYTSSSGCSIAHFITVNANPSRIYFDSAVCQDHSVEIYDSLAGGIYTFVGGHIILVQHGDTATVTGVSTGTDLIYYTAPGGCRTFEAFTVNAYADIVGPTHVCQGSRITLTDIVPGGTWTSSDTTVAVVSGGSDSTYVTGVRTGTVTITYDMGNGCVASHIVIVDTVATLTPSSTPVICANDSLLVTASFPGGTWTSDNTAIATVTAGTPATVGKVRGVSNGVVHIIYTITGSGCSSAITITVNALPDTIMGRDSVCVGDTIQMHDSTIGGTWTFTNGHASVVPTTGVVTGVSAGLDTLMYMNGSGCVVTKTIKINPLSKILFTADTLCVGHEILVSDTTAGGVWSVLHPTIDKIIGVAGTTAIDSGITAGIDTIVYTIPATGCTTFLPIKVNALPSITGIRNHVCVGDTIILTGHPGPGTFHASNPRVYVAQINDSTAKIGGYLAGNDTVMYTLIATGCDTTFIVVVDSTPIAITGNHHLCLGRTELLVSGTAGGTWSVKTGYVSVDTGLIKGDTIGVDTVVYTLPVTGCNAIFPVTVEPIPAITVVHSHPTMICLGGSDTLTASGSAPGTYTWTWAPSFGLSATTGATVVASPSLTTTYTVTGTSQYGCDSFVIVTVVVDDTFLHIKVIGRDNICRGQCDTLMASGRAGTYFNWHPATSLSCTICDTTIACPDTTTTYTGIAIDDIGCKDSVVFTVHVRPLPIINVTPNPAVICYGTPLQLHASTTNTDSNTTQYAWTPNIFISSDSVKNPIINDTANIVYRVIAITEYGCYDSLKVKVSVLDTNVNAIALDTNVCIGGSAQLFATSHSVTGNLDVPTFTWTPVTGLNNPFIWDPVATPSQTTTYFVKIHENACFETTLSVTVFVQPYPIIKITPGSQTIIAGTPVHLVANVENTPVLYYAWAPSSTLSCDSCMNPVAIPTVNTTYTVIVSSIYHCISTDSVTINMLCDNSQIFIPNTFTPNGDGVNDRFWVSGKGISLITLFQVYSRWGQLLYEAHNVPANDPAYGWDGTFKGLVLEPDVFVYIVKARCELGGDEFNYKGDISLVR